MLTALILSLILTLPVKAWSQELIVSAAASLTDAFKDIKPAFQEANPGVEVIVNFASSGALYRQIEQGAPVDVYASANPKWMDKAVQNSYVKKSGVKTFARNSLVLAVPRDNPAQVTALEDLKSSRISSIGIGTPETVPAGQYAMEALTSRGMYQELTPRMIYAESVRQVLDYLRRGQVDCGFVYGTDAVKGGDQVRTVQEIPLKKPVTYPIAVLERSANPDMAEAFVEFVLSSRGLELLENRGFKKP